MALATLIYKGKPGKIGELTLDVTISENHSFTSQVTQFPIEAGAEISDHIINKPVDLSVVGFITNSPVQVFGGILENLITSQVAIPNRVQSAFTLLTDMREIKETFTVVTGLKVYRNMFFKNLTFPRNGRSGDAVQFSASLTRLITAQSRKIVLQNLDPGTTEAKENTKDLAAEKVDRGGQTVQEVDTTTEEGENLQSWGFQLLFGE